MGFTSDKLSYKRNPVKVVTQLRPVTCFKYEWITLPSWGIFPISKLAIAYYQELVFPSSNMSDFIW